MTAEIINHSILQWQDLEAGRSDLRLERVLIVNKPEDYIVTIEIIVDGEDEKDGIGKAEKKDNKDAECKVERGRPEWGIRRRYSEISYAIATNKIRVLEAEIFPHLLRAEKDIKQSHRERRDKIHEYLIPLLGDDIEIYMVDSRRRGAKISELVGAQGNFKLTKMSIYKHFRLYLESGCNPNAFTPLHHKCGAPGRRRVAERQDMPKPGRRSALGKVAGRAIGIRITAEIERKFERGIKRFYKGDTGLEDAFDLISREFFYKELTVENKKKSHILLPPEERPTFDQFRYFYEKVYRRRDPVTENIRRKGERRHNLEDRATIGNAQSLAFAPGSLYQIDPTITDTHIVSSLDRLRLIGRAVGYACMDVFRPR